MLFSDKIKARKDISQDIKDEILMVHWEIRFSQSGKVEIDLSNRKTAEEVFDALKIIYVYSPVLSKNLIGLLAMPNEDHVDKGVRMFLNWDKVLN